MHSFSSIQLGAFVDLGDDRVQSEGRNLVSQNALCRVENFSLPRKMVNEIRNILRVSRAWCDDCCALGFAARNFARQDFA